MVVHVSAVLRVCGGLGVLILSLRVLGAKASAFRRHSFLLLAPLGVTTAPHLKIPETPLQSFAQRDLIDACAPYLFHVFNTVPYLYPLSRHGS